MRKPLMPPPVWFVLFMAVGYLITEPFEVAAFDYTPTASSQLTVIFSGLGLLVALIAVGQFFRQNTTVHPMHPEKATSLVTVGIYRFTRNPMYLGMLLILLGFAFLGHNLLGFVVPVAFVLVINVFQIIPEERALAELFGDEFSAFKKRTPRWFLFF